MSLIVFMRAVNVGKHQRVSVAALAKQLAELDVVNIGAVGTLVVRKRLPASRIQKEIWAKMPFKPELMICSGDDFNRAIRSAGKLADSKGDVVQRFLTAMSSTPENALPLPYFFPSKHDWQVRIVAIEGCLAVSDWRRTGAKEIYPNQVIEKLFKVSSTTRNWNTVQKIADVIAQH